ncbi:MAG: HD domain-containing protein [Acidobacteria bacterium]|nr:HD domain-containing protein [Acidobacteriota bacterium]
MDKGELGLVLKAVAFAAEKHRLQKRKDVEASPYINHPVAVASTLFHEGGVTDVRALCAALLHDTIEDTQTTPEELEQLFGREIKDIVLEVTDDKKLPKEARKQEQINKAATLSLPAKLVKLGDKICNLKDVADSPPAKWDLKRRQDYFEWAKRVVDQIRGTNSGLEKAFDAAYARRPR